MGGMETDIAQHCALFLGLTAIRSLHSSPEHTGCQKLTWAQKNA